MDILHSGVVEVQLSRGLVTIIDAEDFEMVTRHKWCAQRDHNTDYAVRHERIHGKRTRFILHRVLINSPIGMHVDHINGNGLDNRKTNLRACTPSENLRNQRKRKGSSSEFKGVRKFKDGRPRAWMAKVCVGAKTYTQSFYTELEAALWYDGMAMEHYGEFAKLNFPDLAVKPDE